MIPSVFWIDSDGETIINLSLIISAHKNPDGTWEIYTFTSGDSSITLDNGSAESFERAMQAYIAKAVTL